ncbi:MAG: hypothetical protein J6Q94_02630 [Clostridia bacterium]|nr:hypothetical protein [Clostridia bacterium]
MLNSEIQKALNKTESIFADAKNRFFDEKMKLENKASKNINLHSNTALSEASDIIHSAKNLIENLYVTCQTQVKIIDETCRPLINNSVTAKELRDIWQLIVRLNNESDISVDFTASLNYSNLGELAVVTYTPSIECKMIESYWESAYKNCDGRKDLEAEEMRKKQEDEKKRAQARENAQKKEEQKYNARLAQIDKIEAEIIKKRQEKVNNLLKDERATLTKNAEADFKAEKKRLTEILNNSTKERDEAQVLLATTSAVNIFRKHKCKKIIENMNSKIEFAQQGIEDAQKAFDAEKIHIEEILKEKKTRLEKKVKTELPLPRRPRMPLSMKTDNPSVYALVDEGYKEEILKFLEKKGPREILSLTYNSPVSDLTYAKIMGLLKDLEKEGEIEIYKKSSYCRLKIR